MEGNINGIIPNSFKGNTYLVTNKISYQVLNPKKMIFALNQKSEIEVMAWGPGGNSGPNKNGFTINDYTNCFCNGEAICNPSLPNDGSWTWYPQSQKHHTSYFETFIFKYPVVKAPLAGGGSGAYSESNLTLEAGTYYYSVGVTSGTKTWFGPSMNIMNAYVIADTGQDSTGSINQPLSGQENPNINNETKSISFGGLGGQISQSKGDEIIGGNKGTDSYSANNIVGGTGGTAVNPIGNFNGAGGSFGGYGEPGKILLKIESANLDTYDYGQFYYNFNQNNSSGLSGKITGTFSIDGDATMNLGNLLINNTRFAGYSDNEYQQIDNGNQPVPGTWTDPNGTEFSYTNVKIILTNGTNTGFNGKINGYISNDMRLNKKFGFNTLRCWITASQVGDRNCNC